MNLDIFMAAATGDLSWLKQSVSTCTSLTALNENGLNALHLCCLHGQLNCLKYLIEDCQFPVDYPSKSGWCAIHLIINAEIKSRSKKNDDGITPIHQAASEGLEDCLQILLDNGASVDEYDHRGNLPIDLAKLWGHKKCIKLLAHKMWHVRKSKAAKRNLERNRKLAFERLKLNLNTNDEMSNAYIGGNISFYDWYYDLKHRSKKSAKCAIGSSKPDNLLHDKTNVSSQHGKQNKVEVVQHKDRPQWTNALHPSEYFHKYCENLRDLIPKDPITLEIFPYSTPVEINPYYSPRNLDESFENKVASLAISDDKIAKKVLHCKQNSEVMAGKLAADLRSLKRRENKFREMYYKRNDLADHPKYTLPAKDEFPEIKRLHDRETQIVHIFPIGD